MPLSYQYDAAYAGPALPVVEITVSNLVDENQSVELRALVDSGADATMIPLRTLRRLQARKVDEKRARGISGVSYAVDIYEVAIRLGDYAPFKLYAVADPQNEGMILGRDVLNQFVVTLNGLAHIVEISQ